MTMNPPIPQQEREPNRSPDAGREHEVLSAQRATYTDYQRELQKTVPPQQLQEVADSVYRRMAQEQGRSAEQYRQRDWTPIVQSLLIPLSFALWGPWAGGITGAFALASPQFRQYWSERGSAAKEWFARRFGASGTARPEEAAA